MMKNLTTNYLGLKLKNPIIVGASNMVSEISNIKLMEDSGAAAIVYKSLFEEQINLEQALLYDELVEYNDRNAEMTTLFPNIEHAGPDEHLNHLRKAKESIQIPLIASLNAIYPETWVEYARLIEQTGVDALELNLYNAFKSFDVNADELEKKQINTVKQVIEAVKIPVSVKLSYFYSNPLHFIKMLDNTGVSGVVVFNRFYQPDINLNQLSHIASHHLSTPDDHKVPMRFSGLLYKNIKANIAANSGIAEGTDVAKMLLVGADCVQVVSTLYKNKITYLSKMIQDLENWMDQHQFDKLEDFKGRLSKLNTKDPYVYQRAQYIDLLIRSGEMFKSFNLR